jgi:hypothetical protein
MAEIYLWHLPGLRLPHHSTHSIVTAQDYTILAAAEEHSEYKHY